MRWLIAGTAALLVTLCAVPEVTAAIPEPSPTGEEGSDNSARTETRAPRSSMSDVSFIIHPDGRTELKIRERRSDGAGFTEQSYAAETPQAFLEAFRETATKHGLLDSLRNWKMNGAVGDDASRPGKGPKWADTIRELFRKWDGIVHSFPLHSWLPKAWNPVILSPSCESSGQGEEVKHSRPARLGIEVVPVTGALAAQLDLEERTALLVERVVPDMPADKAGIKRHDIIVSFGGKAVTTPEDLRRTLAQRPDRSMKMEIIRRGQRMDLDVRP